MAVWIWTTFCRCFTFKCRFGRQIPRVGFENSRGRCRAAPRSAASLLTSVPPDHRQHPTFRRPLERTDASMIDVLNLALPFFGLIVIGYAAGKIKRLPDLGLAWMNFFLIYISLPCLF